MLGGLLGIGLIVSIVSLPACNTVGFYGQAIFGQMRILRSRTPVGELLESPGIDTALRQRLIISQEILEFAESDLLLAADARYRTYVALDRSRVVWNLFAAPELSLVAKRWCYPVVGCTPYRGYFAEADAMELAEQLHADGLDTYVGGVAAYSTLGWFRDPLLSSFIFWPDADLAGLLIHELAHSRIWVKDDAPFNESFASFVASEGVSTWLETPEKNSESVRFSAAKDDRRRMFDLLGSLKARLQTLYSSKISDAEKRNRKERIIERARACYTEQRSILGDGRFDTVMERLNNAYLVSLVTYDDGMPAFARLFVEVGGNWEQFYREVETLGAMESGQRHIRMNELRDEQIAAKPDDESADEVQCK
ncbi:MAG: aminopeptidase, partial [Gammaproteobacteria bacterium]|nr:aminopeptidase [Gammaproteobacteria bacterium]